MVSPISTAGSQSMQTGLSLLSQVVAPGASEATTTPASAPALSDFQTISPDTRKILSAIIDLFTGKYGSRFDVSYESASGNSDTVSRQTYLPGRLEFTSDDTDTDVTASGRGPNSELSITTLSGNDNISANGNTVTINSGGGTDVIKATAAYLDFVGSGDGEDTLSLGAATVGYVQAGDGNDLATVWGSFVASVDGGEGDDTLDISGNKIWYVAGGSGNDTISVSGTTVGSVEGGDGNDIITVSSKTGITGLGGDAAVVTGGAGDDNITADGPAELRFGRGDGQDTVSMLGGGRIVLSDELTSDPSMEIVREGNSLRISFANGEGMMVDIGSEDEMKVSFDGNVISLTRVTQPEEQEPAPEEVQDLDEVPVEGEVVAEDEVLAEDAEAAQG